MDEPDQLLHFAQLLRDRLQVPRSTIYGHLTKSSIGRRPTAGALARRNSSSGQNPCYPALTPLSMTFPSIGQAPYP
ncbi:hypothetical protein [Arthrobacter sp. UYEF6]|uniref:hypothetical protein n=1 Tax=Pseudarthrobacter sp. S6 TaxID=3418420 RepID=UPI00339A2162